MKCKLLCLLLLISFSLHAQYDYSKKLAGMTIRIGLSNAINGTDNTDLSPSSYLASAFGVYRYFAVNKNHESLIPFHYIKSEINFGNRTGLFKINDFGQRAQIQTKYVDLIVIVPLTWEINDHVAANIGIGSSVGFVTSKKVKSDIVPTPAVPYGNNVKAGFIADWHLLFTGKQNAIVGGRITIEPSQYAYAEWSFYIGFALPKGHRAAKE